MASELQGVASTLRRHKWIAFAISANPGTQRKQERHFNLAQPFKGLLFADAGRTHRAQSAQKGTRLRYSLRGSLRRSPPAFAMIRFRKVRQFKVDGECFCHPVRFNNSQATDYLLS